MTATSGKIRNISGQDLTLPEFGDRLVVAGEAVPVPIDRVIAYTQQLSTWEPFDAPAKAAHNEMLEAIAYIVAVAQAEQEALEHRNEPADDEAEQQTKTYTAKQVVDIVIPSLDADDLAALVETEQLRKTPRKSVLKAAEKRAAELDDGDPHDDPGEGQGDDDSQEG